MEEDGRESTPNSIPALFVDDTEQVLSVLLFSQSHPLSDYYLMLMIKT